MHQIDVHGIRVYSNHGCMPEESVIGSHYEVNISVWADLSASVTSDNLEDTVDYVALNTIAEEEMAVRAELLEVVCQRIIDRIMNEHPMVQKAWINVAKLSPPINGDVERVALTFTADRDKIN
ncbi:MAG TPA: dihydroneopterin aldolase [Cryomorphaceae bacterium]|nr:dihydroneopterin aldolase [Cryomorphaceae bacterium]